MHSSLASTAFKYQQQQQPHQHMDHNLAHVQTSNSSGAMAGAHQHAFSTVTNATNPYNAPQHAGNGAVAQPASAHWQEQLQLCQQTRSNGSPHHHARSPAHRPAPSVSGTKTKKEEEEEKRRAKGNFPRQDWLALDFSGQGLRAISNALFKYTFLDKLYLNHNKLGKLPPAIGRLKLLTHLDVSSNNLVDLPVELGMLTNLRQLLLFDNQLTDIPPELGTLYQLEMLGIEGNPIRDTMKQILVKDGTRALITYLRENCPGRERPTYIYLIPEAADYALTSDSRSSGPTNCSGLGCSERWRQTQWKRGRQVHSALLQYTLRQICNTDNVWLHGLMGA